MKVFYHGDLDGQAAAWCVNHCVDLDPRAKREGVSFHVINYGQRFPLETIAPGEQVWILDYSIEPSEMRCLLEVTADVTWIDHHKTAIEKYRDFPQLIRGLRRDGTAHGLLLWNSNAMDAVLTTDSRLSFRTTGGVLDLYVLAGPSPAQVVEQLTRLVGRPAMPPLWALGFHQSKYGYKDVGELRSVSEEYTRAKIPLDAGE